MQPKQPCSICRGGFREKALVAYHAWFNGQNRICYKQRMCLRCWRSNYAEVIRASTNAEDYDAPDPETCYACGGKLDDDAERTWTTWYRGQQRKDTSVLECPHCAAGLRTVMMNGADRQEDRPIAGVGAGGAPLPNPPGFGKDDLPW